MGRPGARTAPGELASSRRRGTLPRPRGRAPAGAGRLRLSPGYLSTGGSQAGSGIPLRKGPSVTRCHPASSWGRASGSCFLQLQTATGMLCGAREPHVPVKPGMPTCVSFRGAVSPGKTWGGERTINVLPRRNCRVGAGSLQQTPVQVHSRWGPPASCWNPLSPAFPSR